MWMIFDTPAEAEAYATSAANQLPRRAGDVTVAWDIPHALANGQYAVTPFAPDIGEVLPSPMIAKESA